MKKKRKTNSKIKLKGIVMPTDWDEKGNVCAVNISAHDEEEYAVLLNEKGRELVAIIRKTVKVSGSVRSEKNIKIIDVDDYRIINGSQQL